MTPDKNSKLAISHFAILLFFKFVLALCDYCVLMLLKQNGGMAV